MRVLCRKITLFEVSGTTRGPWRRMGTWKWWTVKAHVAGQKGVSHGRMNPNRSLDRMCLYIFRAFMLSAILLFYIGLFLLDHYWNDPSCLQKTAENALNIKQKHRLNPNDRLGFNDIQCSGVLNFDLQTYFHDTHTPLTRFFLPLHILYDKLTIITYYG